MAGFNSVTSPLTFQNAQNTYKAMTTPTPTKTTYTAPKVSTPTLKPGNTALPGSYVAPKPVVVDPYAKWGGYAGYSRAVNDYNSAKNTAYGSINSAIDNTGIDLNSSVLDFLGNLTKGQRAVDQAAVQNEMARMQGRNSVMDMIGQGLRSGGVLLANKGSTNSSAGEALAKAYNQIGRQNLSQVGNEYALGQENVANQQLNLNEDTATFQRKYGENKTKAVNSIVEDASNRLAQLNAAAQNASLADRINIESEKARIRSDALNKLGQYDNTLQTGISGTVAASADTNRAKASELLNAGTAPENSFDFTTAGPAEFVNTGPFSSPLQVFSYPGKKKNTGA